MFCFFILIRPFMLPNKKKFLNRQEFICFWNLRNIEIPNPKKSKWRLGQCVSGQSPCHASVRPWDRTPKPTYAACSVSMCIPSAPVASELGQGAGQASQPDGCISAANNKRSCLKHRVRRVLNYKVVISASHRQRACVSLSQHSRHTCT